MHYIPSATVSLFRSEVTVAVTKQQRFSPTSNGNIDCWFYKPEGINQLFPDVTEEIAVADI